MSWEVEGWEISLWTDLQIGVPQNGWELKGCHFSQPRFGVKKDHPLEGAGRMMFCFVFLLKLVGFDIRASLKVLGLWPKNSGRGGYHGGYRCFLESFPQDGIVK